MLGRLVQRILNVREDEVAATVWSCAYFFFILCGYYILRPLREEMGLAGGVRNLPWLFLATLAAMLVATPMFGALVTRFPRRVFVPVVYRFFAVNLLVFYVLLRFVTPYLPASADIHIGRVFYVWLSVFNLFAVSVFWSFMADGYVYPRSKRLFGCVAVGGTLGAIVGAALTAAWVGTVGRVPLLLVSVVMLELAVLCAGQLGQIFGRESGGEDHANTPEPDRPPKPGGRQNSRRLGGAALRGRHPAAVTGTEARPTYHVDARPPKSGGVLAGISLTFRSSYLLGVSGYLFLYTLLGTFLYFQQAWIVQEVFGDDRAAKTILFARVDLWTNLLTLAAQLFLAGRIMSRLGVGAALAALPILCIFGFAVLSWAPILVVLVAFQVLRRGVNYGVSRPARETLYTVVSRDEKYKAKSFIDTFVYRGGDAIGAGAFGALTGEAIGLGLTGVALTAIPLAVIWAAVAFWLGARQKRMAAS